MSAVPAGIFLTKLNMAGSTVNENRNSSNGPMAPRIANSLMGKIRVTDNDRNPAEVVIAVKNAGFQMWMIVA